jgi:hypothetical protein
MVQQACSEARSESHQGSHSGSSGSEAVTGVNAHPTAKLSKNINRGAGMVTVPSYCSSDEECVRRDILPHPMIQDDYQGEKEHVESEEGTETTILFVTSKQNFSRGKGSLFTSENFLHNDGESFFVKDMVCCHGEEDYQPDTICTGNESFITNFDAAKANVKENVTDTQFQLQSKGVAHQLSLSEPALSQHQQKALESPLQCLKYMQWGETLYQKQWFNPPEGHRDENVTWMHKGVALGFYAPGKLIHFGRAQRDFPHLV